MCWCDPGISLATMPSIRWARRASPGLVATALALTGRPAPAQVVNVCSGVPTTLIEACEILADCLGTDVRPRVVGGFRPGDMRHCLGDAAPLEALLGRAPVPFVEGARLTFGTANAATRQ